MSENTTPGEPQEHDEGVRAGGGSPLEASSADRWSAVVEGRISVTQALMDEDGEPPSVSLRERFTPLSEHARAELAEQMADTYLRSRGHPAAGRAAGWVGRAARWIAPSALAAAVFLVLWPWSRPVGPTMTAEVRALATTRAARDVVASGGALHVKADEQFLLECRTRDRPFSVQSVLGNRLDEHDAAAPPQLLGAYPLTSEPRLAELQVRADLARGRWAVTCGVVEADSGRYMVLDPPVIIVVE